MAVARDSKFEPPDPVHRPYLIRLLVFPALAAARRSRRRPLGPQPPDPPGELARSATMSRRRAHRPYSRSRPRRRGARAVRSGPSTRPASGSSTSSRSSPGQTTTSARSPGSSRPTSPGRGSGRRPRSRAAGVRRPNRSGPVRWRARNSAIRSSGSSPPISLLARRRPPRSRPAHRRRPGRWSGQMPEPAGSCSTGSARRRCPAPPARAISASSKWMPWATHTSSRQPAQLVQ